jgi:hypothetical protein
MGQRPNSELVVTTWLKGVSGLNNIVATTLPKDQAWASTGFVVITAIGGTYDHDLFVYHPIVQVDCYAMSAGSGKPLWNTAHDLMETVQRGINDDANIARTLTLPANYSGCQNVRVFSAFLARMPQRLYRSDLSAAIVSADFQFFWTGQES